MSTAFNRHLVVGMIVLSALLAGRTSADELGQRASWSTPKAEEVKQQVDQWLKDVKLEPEQKAQLEALWPAEGGLPESSVDLLEQLAATVAVVDPQARDLVVQCRADRQQIVLPTYSWLSDDKTPALVRHNLRLLYGRWLVQQRLYDEALLQLKDLKPEDVVDPASLLFFQGVAHHRLLEKDQCLPVIAKLLENEESIPRRYSAVAHLMASDIKPLKTDSLDEVARLMDDIRRRLDLGRAGKKVRTEEDDVIAKLDKMIDDLQKQQQQQQQQSSSSSGSNQPSSPMQDSNAADNKGPGNVDPRSIGNKAGWGNLPDKQRQEALQQISKEFPSHFRDVIEAYFKKLAQEGAEK